MLRDEAIGYRSGISLVVIDLAHRPPHHSIFHSQLAGETIDQGSPPVQANRSISSDHMTTVALSVWTALPRPMFAGSLRSWRHIPGGAPRRWRGVRLQPIHVLILHVGYFWVPLALH